MVNRSQGAWVRAAAAGVAAGLALFAAGCGDGDDDDPVIRVASAPAPLPGGGTPAPPPVAGIPAVTSVSPAIGPSAGGTPVQLAGVNFALGATVAVGNQPATVTGFSPTSLSIVTPVAPPGVTGPLDVTVTNPNGGAGALSQAFSFVAVTAATGTAGVRETDLDIDDAGVVHAVWHAALANGDVETHYLRSTDNGRSWGDAALLQRTSNAASRPRIGAGGGSVMVVWNEVVGGNDQVTSARSVDAGVSWSGASALVTTPGQRPDADIDVDGNGRATVAHLQYGGLTSLGNVQSHLRTVSATVGSSLGAPITIAGGAVQAQAPVVAADGAGRVALAWLAESADTGGDRELYATISSDGGATYLAGAQITQATASGITPGAPTIDLFGSRAVIAFVQDGLDHAGQPVTDVMAAISNDAGLTWPGGGPVAGGAAGVQRFNPVVCATGAGDVHVAWQDANFGTPVFDIASARSTNGGGSWAVVRRSGTTNSSILPAIAGGSSTRVIHLWVEGVVLKSY